MFEPPLKTWNSAKYRDMYDSTKPFELITLRLQTIIDVFLVNSSTSTNRWPPFAGHSGQRKASAVCWEGGLPLRDLSLVPRSIHNINYCLEVNTNLMNGQ